MEIFYKKDTLYVNLDDYIDEDTMNKVRSRVFGIIDDYDINNIVLNIIGNVSDEEALDAFINEYKIKYDGNLSIK